jgi:hypothetical protein
LHVPDRVVLPRIHMNAFQPPRHPHRPWQAATTPVGRSTRSEITTVTCESALWRSTVATSR